MSVKLIWWGGEPPAWLAAHDEHQVIRVSADDAESLLTTAAGQPLVLIDAGLAPATLARGLALLRVAHAPCAIVGANNAGSGNADVRNERLVSNAADLASMLAGCRSRHHPFRLLVKECSNGKVRGTLLSGKPDTGMRVVMLPGGDTAAIRRCDSSTATGSTQLSLDPPLEANDGALLSQADDRPEVTDQIAAHVVWIDATRPMLPGRPYRLDLAGQKASATVTALKYRLKPETDEHIAARRLSTNEIGFCNLSFDRPVCFDPASKQTPLGSFTLADAEDGRALARGYVEFGLRRATNVHWQALSVDRTARASLKGQRPCCLWFTGLSGSGKSTVASLLERRLHGLGRHTYVLDGDNVRHGLNRDLGFTDADRVENIRRVAEVAKLMADAGLIVMVSFISPFRTERQLARTLFKDGEFLEVFVDAPIEVCEARDPKGLYKKARAGLIRNFTGIDSAYEPPTAPEIRLAAGKEPAEALVERIMGELIERGMVPEPRRA